MEQLYLFVIVIGSLALLAKSLLFRFYEEKFSKDNNFDEISDQNNITITAAEKATMQGNDDSIVCEVEENDLLTLFNLIVQLRPYMRRDGSGQYDEFVNDDRSIIDPLLNHLSADFLSTIKCGCKSLYLPIGKDITAKLWFDNQFNSWHYRQQLND